MCDGVPQYSSLLEPIEPTNRENIGRLKQLLAGHKRFCEQQLSNKKTSRVLEAAFDPEWTEQYMTQLMFDYSPTYSPPWFDGSVAQLYNYFEENPEPSVVEQAYTQRREALNYRTASEYLTRILQGEGLCNCWEGAGRGAMIKSLYAECVEELQDRSPSVAVMPARIARREPSSMMLRGRLHVRSIAGPGGPGSLLSFSCSHALSVAAVLPWVCDPR
jgi:hypothetical protein